jgi:peptide/histidine transporter 3/4
MAAFLRSSFLSAEEVFSGCLLVAGDLQPPRGSGGSHHGSNSDPLMSPDYASISYTCNGSVDIRGNPASKNHTGKWRACYSILGGEFCGALAYYGVGTNLVSYLTKVQQQSNVAAASNIASWQGTCYLSPLLGAFLADSYWGRHRTIVISLTTFTIGMILLTLSAIAPASIHPVVISLQHALPFLGLFLTALG